MMLQSFYQNKKVLITGHTGFKGSWLSQILLNMGANVVGYALPPNTQPALFDILGLEKKTEHHLGDIRDFSRLKKLLVQCQPEIIFHLAAQPLVRESYDDPLTTFETNIIGTVNLLQAVKETGSAKAVVVVTTDKVYDDKDDKGNDYCYKEDDRLAGYDPYSASKVGAEIVVESYIKSFFHPQHYNSRHQTLLATARAGNVIGGGDWAKDRLVPDIVKAVFERKERFSIRNPEAVRPWQFVLEPLQGYLLLAQKLYQAEREFAQPWNFGPNPSNFLTVEEIVKKSLGILKSGSYFIESDDIKHETKLLKLDINRARNILGWQPVFDIEAVLFLTLDWYRTFYQRGNAIFCAKQQIDLFFNQLNQIIKQ